jgi:hypothetical protein
MEDLLTLKQFRENRPEAFPGEYSRAIKTGVMKVFAKVTAHLLIERFNGHDEGKNPIFSKDTLAISGYYCLDDKVYRTIFGSKKLLIIQYFNPDRFIELTYEGGKSFADLADNNEIKYGLLQFSFPVKIIQDDLLVLASSNWDATSLLAASPRFSDTLPTPNPDNSLKELGETAASLGRRGGEISAQIKQPALEKRDEPYVQYIIDHLRKEPPSPKSFHERLLSLSDSAIKEYELPLNSRDRKKRLTKKSYRKRLMAQTLKRLEQEQRQPPQQPSN